MKEYEVEFTFPDGILIINAWGNSEMEAVSNATRQMVETVKDSTIFNYRSHNEVMEEEGED